jgi:hypothetical protein
MEYGQTLLCAFCFRAHLCLLLSGNDQSGTLPDQAPGHGGENKSLVTLGKEKASTNKNCPGSPGHSDLRSQRWYLGNKDLGNDSH